CVFAAMATNPSNPDSIQSPGPLVTDEGKASQLLREGEVVSCILAPVGSNYTFLAKIQDDSGQEIRAVYKPRDGEAPLWDFDSGTLYKREYAAYLLSQVLGWYFIPETVIREGPYGIGSMQRYVDHEQNSFYRAIRESHREELKTIACFDVIANNADRKDVHCIRGLDGRIWGIDHGLTFNHVPTLRTVIWDFWGEPLPPRLQKPLEALLKDVEAPSGQLKELIDLLQPQEVEALVQRVSWLVSMKSFPKMRRY
ncbi:MAG: SCO1664 family protein, partial [Dehalococcoidia bacterium]